ncbi:MAG: pyridoxal phosphate-dependent aminotransferase [Myxococcota bacterium]|nr:pyridoxal phosphate-dependent aminotransferase [Myxococcota bacterium]
MNIAERLNKVKPSATLAMSARAKAMKAEGKNIISLAAGEPDFDTPEHIKDAARKALVDGQTKYTPVAGTPKLRACIADFASKVYGTSIRPAQTMVCAGAKHALFNLCHAMLNPGDEAAVIAPYWVSYPDMIHLQGAETKIIPTEANNNFTPEIETIEKVLSAKTKLLFINSPNNPTGSVYPFEFYEALADLLEQYPQCYVVSDDIYHGLCYQGAFTGIYHAAPNLRERILLINGVSKTYAMTGWRIGFLIGPPDLIGAMSRIQGASTSGVCSIAQAAACAALSGAQDKAQDMHSHFRERRDLIFEGLGALPQVSVVKPEGAFYIFPDFQDYLGGSLKTSIELCEYLLEEALVASVAGMGFGAEGFIRMSFATSTDEIEEALARIAKALKQIQK